MASLSYTCYINTPICSSLLQDQISLLPTQITFNNRSAHRVRAKNIIGLPKLVKTKNAFRVFDGSPELIIPTSTKNGYSISVGGEKSDLGTIEKGNLTNTNPTQNAFKSLGTPGVSDLPDRLSVISNLSECSSVGSLLLGKSYHGLSIKIGFDHDKFVRTSLVSMYSKCGDIENASKMFEGSENLDDVISWNSLMSGYSSNGMFDEALKLCMQVFSSGIRTNHYTFSIGFSVCGAIKAVREGKQLHTHSVKMQYFTYTAVGNSLITMYSKFGMMDEVEVLFKDLPERNLISWTAVITGFHQHKFFHKALEHFNSMRRNGVEPNEHTFAIALASCGGIRYSNYGKMVHAQTVKNGMVSGVFVGTALLDMYSETEQMDEAERQFEEMGSSVSDVSWNALVAGYVQNGRREKAMETFDRMVQNDILFDEFTYSNILKVCCSLPSLSSGEQIHARVIKFNCESNEHVGSSLIEMYTKGGSLSDAEQVFRLMPNRDVISWNSMIKAYSQNGYPKKAISLFRKMIEEGMKPTSSTFIAVLSACSHSGLVEEGLEHFGSMIRDYNITPEETHFSCMVDILSRAGQLEVAKDFITNSPIKPKASTWRPLLAACRSQKNLKLAEFVAKRIMEIEPNDPTVYITLSNMYAEAERWDEVEKVRKLMKQKGVKKEPGCSWIEVNNKIYKFYSRDMKQTEMANIYGKLKDLVKQIKEIGYIPDTSFVLHQGIGVSKEEQVLYHSEKLAVCFGLLNLSKSNGRPIRVFKNLRVCQDCHSAMKYISSLTKRDIVLKDNYRFHYFKQGLCSCGDYW